MSYLREYKYCNGRFDYIHLIHINVTESLKISIDKKNRVFDTISFPYKKGIRIDQTGKVLTTLSSTKFRFGVYAREYKLKKMKMRLGIYKYKIGKRKFHVK